MACGLPKIGKINARICQAAFHILGFVGASSMVEISCKKLVGYFFQRFPARLGRGRAAQNLEARGQKGRQLEIVTFPIVSIILPFIVI